MNNDIITKIEGIPDELLRGKKIVLTNGEVLIYDLKSNETLNVDDFLKKYRSEIRDNTIELIFS